MFSLISRAGRMIFADLSAGFYVIRQTQFSKTIKTSLKISQNVLSVLEVRSFEI